MYYLLDPTAYFSVRSEADTTLVLLFNSYNNDLTLLNNVIRLSIQEIHSREFVVSGVYSGNFLSDRVGYSITVLSDRDGSLGELLEKPTSAWGWNCQSGLGKSSVMNPPPGKPDFLVPLGPVLQPPEVGVVNNSFKFAIRAVIDEIKYLDEIDLDGIYGTNMSKGLKALWEAKREDKLMAERPYNFFENISRILERNIPGLAGSIYGCFFAGVALEFVNYSSLGKCKAEMWSRAFVSGVSTIHSYTKLELGDGSLMDALIPAAEALKQPVGEKELLEYFEKVVEAAERGSESTKDIRTYRRKNWLEEVGSHCVSLWMRGAFQGFKEMMSKIIRASKEGDQETTGA